MEEGEYASRVERGELLVRLLAPMAVACLLAWLAYLTLGRPANDWSRKYTRVKIVAFFCTSILVISLTLVALMPSAKASRALAETRMAFAKMVEDVDQDIRMIIKHSDTITAVELNTRPYTQLKADFAKRQVAVQDFQEESSDRNLKRLYLLYACLSLLIWGGLAWAVGMKLKILGLHHLFLFALVLATVLAWVQVSIYLPLHSFTSSACKASDLFFAQPPDVQNGWAWDPPGDEEGICLGREKSLFQELEWELSQVLVVLSKSVNQLSLSVQVNTSLPALDMNALQNTVESWRSFVQPQVNNIAKAQSHLSRSVASEKLLKELRDAETMLSMAEEVFALADCEYVLPLAQTLQPIVCNQLRPVWRSMAIICALQGLLLPTGAVLGLYMFAIQFPSTQTPASVVWSGAIQGEQAEQGVNYVGLVANEGGTTGVTQTHKIKGSVQSLLSPISSRLSGHFSTSFLPDTDRPYPGHISSDDSAGL
eukprot:g45408.t1